ncbi:hypothetical protein M408DRAFT_74647 [Serendipita vermifera MAFF 305830]|uniref:Helicase ATP-binding domain-containing protein n=1 Tax=Serendipita vermifera MAFF 305830 TaxID=933852 RepID=A0A0C3B146_SERVB|nr:hypothetical protein M408DRAFT_74647 [Serendipita vermifera MAFF 305830]
MTLLRYLTRARRIPSWTPRLPTFLYATPNLPRASSIKASDEQQAVVASVTKGHNVVVSARPGSGKTATATYVAEKNRNKPILVLTYSKSLQLKTERDMKTAGLDNVDVYTFHSFAGKMYDTIVENDDRLLQVCTSGNQPILPKDYEIVVLDEAQDLTPTLYQFTCTLLSALARSLPKPPTLLVIGDPRQAIYDYQEADARYLQRAPELYSEYCPGTWDNLPLTTSFRLTEPTGNLVNVCSNEKYIHSLRPGPKPIYAIANMWDSNALAKFLLPYIKKYGPENTAIIAPSVKTRSPIANIANGLCRFYKIPIAEPMSDDGRLDEDIIRNKLPIATYHQFKGDERDLIILFGADASYFRYFARTLPNNEFPNTLFVAMTRGKQLLVIVKSDKEDSLPFVSEAKLHDACEVVNVSISKPSPQESSSISNPVSKPKYMRVSELVKHIPEQKLAQLIRGHVQVIKHSSRSATIDIPNKICTNRKKRFWESVSDINVVAITAAFQHQWSGTCFLLDGKGGTKETGREEITPRFFAKRAAKHCAEDSGYEVRTFQIQDHQYHWLDKDLPRAIARLEEQFDDNSLLKFRQSLSGQIQPAEGEEPADLRGFVDIIEENRMQGLPTTLWKIKLSSPTSANIAQHIVHGLLWSADQAAHSQDQASPFPRLMLINGKNEEKLEVIANSGSAAAFTRELFRLKSLAEADRPLDEEFLRRCEQIRAEVREVKWE